MTENKINYSNKMLKPKSDITFNIHGGNVQVLPNATTAVQNVFGSSNSKVETPLDPYVHDREERVNYVQRITACTDMTTLCKTVLADLYNDVLADYEGSKELVKSKPFIEAVLSLCTFEQGKTEENLRHHIRRYVLGEK